MSVDLRSRQDTSEPRDELDIGVFFPGEFAAALKAHRCMLKAGIAYLKLKPFSFDVDGQCWTLAYNDGDAHVVSGTLPGAAQVRLSSTDFSGLIHDLYTPMTFFTGGTLDLVQGTLGDFLDTWLVLRAALDGRPIYTPGSIAFTDIDGGPLDLHQSFTLDDDPQRSSHFLHEAGFLHLRNVFSEEEMAKISREMDVAAPAYFDGDHQSWWARTQSGENRLVRMQGFDQRSAAAAALIRSPGFLRLGDLTGDQHRHSGLKDNRIEALIKPLEVVKGLSDLPWHKDCSLGRHSYDCCSLTVGISVTGADETSGQLRVIAGSHRALMWTALIDSARHDLPDIPLPTRTGDVTVHLSCTLHMAQAPTERERRVMYTDFRLPARNAEAAEASLERINAVREGAYTTVSQ